MAAASRQISPMEAGTPLVTTQDMWKVRLESVNKMTSGVFYSVLMHSLLITAYVLLVFQIFYINEFDLDLLNDVVGLCFFYLICIVVEVVVRQWYGEEYPVHVTKVGHVGHLLGTFFLTAFMVPANSIEAILFPFLMASLVWWTSFGLLAAFLVALIAHNEELSLTQPLV